MKQRYKHSLRYLFLLSFILLISACGGSSKPETPTPAPIKMKVFAGFNHSCAILDNDAVKCWGANGSGQLGLGDTNGRGDELNEMGNNLPAVDLGTGRTAKALALGFDHTCAILDNDAVKCWGFNFYGQLGLGDPNDRGNQANQMGDDLPAVNLGTGRTAKALAIGAFHTCAILDNDAVKCWGGNDFGQLGLGDNDRRGNQANQMGDDLPAVNLGTGRAAKALVGGSNHTCAILDNDAVKCWGFNGSGQLGLGDNDHRGNQANQMGDNLPVVNLGTGRTAKALALVGNHTCAILDNDAVKCWGFNFYGQLGLGYNIDRGNQAIQMGDDLPAVDLGTGRTAKALAVGGDHTCAILDNDAVKCWGYNDYGQLGLGDTNDRGDQANQMGDDLPAVDLGTGRAAKALALGATHTCVILDNDAVKCWGFNFYGQLGLGDNDRRGNQANQMGDDLPAVDLGM